MALQTVSLSGFTVQSSSICAQVSLPYARLIHSASISLAATCHAQLRCHSPLAVHRPLQTSNYLRADLSRQLSASPGPAHRGLQPAQRQQRKAGQCVQVSAKGEGQGLDRIVGVAVRSGRQGLDAATKLIPESVPRPVATVGVGLAGVILLSWVAKALFNTVLSVVVVGGLGYAAFMYYTKDDGSDDDGGSGGSSKSSGDPLDDARRIMEKYK